MKVIVLNGPMGAGKTTTGKYIANTNPGTAFIDGDWCMDIHPFVGNRQTKAMAVDNILHMIANYKKCSECKMIVLTWLMDNKWVYDAVINGISAMDMEIKSATLICDEIELIDRWKKDDKCEWRTDEWLEISLKSLQHFSLMENCMDTTGLSIEQVAEVVLK